MLFNTLPGHVTHYQKVIFGPCRVHAYDATMEKTESSIFFDSGNNRRGPSTQSIGVQLMLSRLPTLNRLIVISALLASIAGCADSPNGAAYSSARNETPRRPHAYPCQDMHVKTVNCPVT
jgi:hypothetical protein